MPTYCYLCPKCGHRQEAIKPMSESDKTVRCGKCRRETNRDHAIEHTSAMGEWTDELESNAAGVMPNQVAEARAFAKARGIEIGYKNDGTALFKSHNSRKRALRALGLMDKSAWS